MSFWADCPPVDPKRRRFTKSRIDYQLAPASWTAGGGRWEVETYENHGLSDHDVLMARFTPGSEPAGGSSGPCAEVWTPDFIRVVRATEAERAAVNAASQDAAREALRKSGSSFGTEVVLHQTANMGAGGGCCESVNGR